MNRPSELTDRIYDFTSSPTLSFPIELENILSPAPHYIYIVDLEAGNSTVVYLDNNGGKHPQPAPVLTSTALTRKISGPGLTYDAITQYTPTPLQQGFWQYLIFQQAKAIIKDLSTGNNITQGQTFSNILQNASMSFDTTSTVGANISKLFTIEVTDINNNYITATLNSDYQVTTGTINPNVSNTVTLKFLKSNVGYRITLTASGYNSISNPYGGDPALLFGRSLITQNSSTLSFLVNTYTGNPVNNTITFPTIDCSVVPQYSVSTTPITTYQNSNIIITGNLNLTLATWIVTNLQTSVSTTRNLNLNDWLTEISVRYNIVLNIVNKTTGALYTSLQGLGPHTLTLPQGDFLAQFNYVSL